MIEMIKDNFTQIPNRITDDKEVSDKTKAVYVKMRSITERSAAAKELREV